ncbi:transcriptional regulator, MerR family [Desulfurobacterium thermolithotrophum DSM 11699]|uniref:Transcriptional regulator, MerR family n=1 Tax=Desulfurobacterium thermolithotrophum (strain DSM 11699 / BSA) TaxID=868864 RepID=F0S2V9_DESTD|nr:MerR family transcriptional regulator [Desulfurobacterium thermolithotrophum]ADY73181.1 transcriptional regulator, MerR family [Desulfurobacterium thermolithotrophum DSM 11699]
MIDKDTPVYMISIVAKIAGVHPQTLRFYENEGLIKPSRTEGRTRLYSERDLVRVKRIVSLTRERGVNVAGTHLILKLEDDLEKLFTALAQQLDDSARSMLITLLKELRFEELDTEKLLDILKK